MLVFFLIGGRGYSVCGWKVFSAQKRHGSQVYPFNFEGVSKNMSKL